ncbi:MAG: hypothetical protein H6737_28100 [Alphaproteobacteria bacterium]|nr:hypothetical protein [Alphaproteobacteria bacterium]
MFLSLLLACQTDPAAVAPLDTDVPAEVDDTDLRDTAEPAPDPDPLPEEEPEEPITPPAPACSLGPHARTFTLNVGNRSAIVDLPPGYDGTEQLPTALNFHGLLMSGALQKSYTGFADAANARGWIAVHPNGQNNTWDVTPWSNDVDFVADLLDALGAEVCVDPSRTYATGLSMGGYFSYLLGCRLPNRFAAIAPVAGLDANVFCSTPVDVPLLHIHGTGDLIVPYGGSFLSPGAQESVRRWSDRVNGCNVPSVVTYQDPEVTCETRTCGPASEATLCTIAGGGHTWPGAAPIPLLTDSNAALDANAEVLDFFELYYR